MFLILLASSRLRGVIFHVNVISLSVGELNNNAKLLFGTTPWPLAKIVSGDTPNCKIFKSADPATAEPRTDILLFGFFNCCKIVPVSVPAWPKASLIKLKPSPVVCKTLPKNWLPKTGFAPPSAAFLWVDLLYLLVQKLQMKLLQ